jgi:hypothetical protein
MLTTGAAAIKSSRYFDDLATLRLAEIAGQKGWTNGRNIDRQDKWVLASPTSATIGKRKVA